MNKIRKGDEIVVIAGKDKGRRGKVSQVLANGKLVVEGVNVAKKHQKPNPNAGIAGGVVEKEMPLDVSNVMLWNPKTSKGDRVGFRFEGEGEKRRKVRVFKSSQELVDG
ncbi:50S ribosomal protein L24 [Fontimonas sp. SYSU GA230001]|uniref:50S ribosomal protein L24 n=1 Tax=Fontimonas sp. SYSU GA230001 TaxID=3142450 RepID=UPI0032B3C00F